MARLTFLPLSLIFFLFLATLAAPLSAQNKTKDKPAPTKSLDLPFPIHIPISNQKHRVALMNNEGDIIFPPEALHISRFAKVSDNDDESHATWLAPAQASNIKWGYLDQTGSWRIKPQFDQARIFTEDNIARVQINEKWAYIKPDGSYLVKPTYFSAKPFYSGLAVVRTVEDSPFQVINTKGELAFKKEFLRIGNYSPNGLAAAQKGRSFLQKITNFISKEKSKNKWGYIDKQGNWAIEPKFDYANKFNQHGIAKVFRKDAIAPTAKVASSLVRSLKTDDPEEKLNTLFEMYIPKAYGTINEKGEWMVKPKYELLLPYSDSGVAWAESRTNHKTTRGYVDTKGKLLWKGEYHDYWGEHNGLMLNHRNGFTYNDPYGKPIIKEKSIWASNFYDKQVTVALRKAPKATCPQDQANCEKWGLLYRDGTFKPFDKNFLAPLTDKTYHNLIGFRYGLLIAANKQGEVLYYNRDGHLAFTLKANANKQLALFDQQEKILWQSDLKAFRASAFLSQTAQDHFKDIADYQGGIIKTIKKLFTQKPHPYDVYQENIYDDISRMYSEEEIKALRHGAAKELAHAYISEDNWGTYYFLYDNIDNQFKHYKKQLVQQISQVYGAPSKDIKRQSKTIWIIDDKKLELTIYNDTGDGDFFYKILLELVENKNEPATNTENQ